MNVYRVDVQLIGTAYIRAASEQEARAKLDAIEGTSDSQHIDSELPISGLQFDDPDLPEVSLSPALTLVHGPTRETFELVDDGLAGIQIGAAYIFDYPAAFTTLPDYTAHAGQIVAVVRQLTNDECDPECQPMFQIRAADGWIGHANSSELTEWSGTPDPADPDNFWIDDETGERVNAHTGERSAPVQS